jgi:Micrococcal nuclease (thermonuclease) homologs
MRVIDGDTVEIRYQNGSTETVRLLGVDTPETPPNSVSPGEFEGVADTDAGQDHLTEWGGRATGFAENNLAGRNVRLVVDSQADRRGGYGRLLGYIYIDGKNFNRLLLTNGYARLYESEFRYRDRFAAAEATAQQEGVGLWGYQ